MLERPVLKLPQAAYLPTGLEYTDFGATRLEPLKRNSKFHVEYRSLGARPRTFLQFAAEPDVIRELYAAADQLQDVPRESTATKEDMIFFNRRIARRIRSIAERVEVKQSGAAPAPWNPRRVPKPSVRRGATAADQLAMAF